MNPQQRPHRSPRRPAAALVLTVGLTLLYATGIGERPAGAGWAQAYDVVLYNLPYLAAALACLGAVRVRAERVAWTGLAVALVLSAVGNALRVHAAGPDGTGPTSAAASAFALAGYALLYVPIVGLIRVRVPRFHASMWLDGVIGALGSLAAGFGFLLGPYLTPGTGHDGITLPDLVGPITDLLLLAVLVSLGAVLAVRLDRTLLLITVALVCTCASDIRLFSLQVADRYHPGGPLELGWLVGISLVALAATDARDRSAPLDAHGRSRIGGRLLAVPVVCTAASLVVLAVGWTRPLPAISGWLAVGCVLAGVLRVAVTFREVRDFNQVNEEARTDELTGLANRRALLERAKQVVAASSARRPAALLLLDLDGFKEVNDSLGHTAGDDLLRQVGPRIATVLRSGDLLARLGGDEFAVLLPSADVEEARALAHRLRTQLLEPFTVDGIRLHVGVSVGVATSPVPAATIGELLRCADVAMYSAKSSREGVHVHVPDPTTGGAGDRLRTMEELRTALAEDQLVIHLQPQVALDDGRVVGTEALVRWQHPTRGLLSPAVLLPAAEQAGLMQVLAETVLELSLAAAGRWWPERRVPISVNLSAANVTDLDMPSKVAAALERHGLPPQALTLELVEDTLMSDPERGRTVLAELRRRGIRTSIDDYGTGYSSLAYLRHLPADELKLDRSLTADVDHDPRAAAIVQHTVALAHDLGLTMVAEGVEDAATGAALTRLGCDVAQGYAIARPMPVGDFLGWLTTHDPDAWRQEPAGSVRAR